MDISNQQFIDVEAKVIPFPLVNSVSGGKTSAFLAVHFPASTNLFSCVCIDNPKCKPKDPAVLKYAETKLNGNFIASAEADLTLKALMDFEQFLGKDITWHRGSSFDSIIKESSSTRLPSWARRYCTTEMKIKTAFEYIYFNGLAPCINRIGFRYDEKYRVQKFYYDKDGKPKNPHHYSYPIYCNVYGKKRQSFKSIYYRKADFPLIKNKITKQEIVKYWADKPVKFPVISNCVGCFHKDPYILNKMFKIEPEKMQWFADIENFAKIVPERRTKIPRQIQMGTWLDIGITYERIKNMNFNLEIPFDEFPACESGACTD